MKLNVEAVLIDLLRTYGPKLLETFALGFVVQAVFLFLALLILTKVQKLKANVAGLLGAAALASALSFIPFAGIPLAVIALLFCVTKAIGARTFTDALLPTVAAYAATFCFNFFVISALLGGWHLSTTVRARSTGTPSTNGIALTDSNSVTANSTPVSSAVPASDKSNNSAAPAPRAQAITLPKAVPMANTNLAAVGKMVEDVAAHFTIKGISKGIQTIAMISNGTRTYDVVAGDAFQMQTAGGKANVVCRTVEENKVVLDVEGVAVTIQHK